MAELTVHPAEFWTGVEAIEKISKRKICIAGDRGDCAGPIVGAHTIPRSQLAKIAEGGHVYCFRATAADLHKNDGQFVAAKRGIHQFSVLNFFCAEHDRKIFLHLENDELCFDRHQLVLLHYRAMGAELYKKMAALEATKYQISEAKRRPLKERSEPLKFLDGLQTGQTLGLRDMAQTFPRCESIIVDQCYDQIEGLVVRFRKPPTIMTVGGFLPEFDYQGRTLQRLGRFDLISHGIGLSIIATPEGSAIAFTWLKEATVCKEFAQSFITAKRDLLTTLAIQTAFEHIENTCMRPSWWDSLLAIERTKLTERMQFAGSSFDERLNSCLMYTGVTFDNWEYANHEFAL